MSSSALNRSAGTMNNTPRTSRLNSYQSGSGRADSEEKSSQNATYGQTYGNGSAWQANGGIWGSTAIGSGLANGKRDTSHPRIEDDGSTFRGLNGLTATSEEDTQTPWAKQNNGPWNPDTTSPTSTNHSGSTSPVRHRTNSGMPSMMLSETNSPFGATPRSTMGLGQALGNRAQPKSSLDPASGPFKYPSFTNGQSYAFNDEKENSAFRRESVTEIEDGASPYRHRGSFTSAQGTASREPSLPPSRQSDSNPNGFNNYFSGNSSSGFGHTHSNSVQRPMTGRASSYLNQSGSQSFDLSMAGMHLSDRPNQSMFSNSPATDNYQIQGGWKSGQNGSSNSGYQVEAHQSSYESPNYRQTLAMGRGTGSPRLDYQRNPTSPGLYSANGSLSLPSYPVRSALDYERGFTRQAQPHLNQQLLNAQFSSQNFHQFDSRAYHQDFRSAIPGSYGYTPYSPGISAPRGPARDQQDAGHGVRSTILEEFRSNSKTNRRYELKDIYTYVVEFSGDQHGSRFIQQKLETANSDEKEQIFNEIQPNALQLMTDVFGNYVIQKLFEHGNQIQKRILADIMRNHVNELSVQMYGCRVVQKALEHVLADQQAELVKELEVDVLRCVKDQNGNHVIQKAIERVPAEHIQFIMDAFKGQVHSLAAHPYGCRVIQRMLEFCSEKDQAVVLGELFDCATSLITDQYGNYVIQHVIARGKDEDRAKIIKIVTAQLLQLSKHKFASNVVEKSIQFCTDAQRHTIVSQMTVLHQDGSSPLQLMMKDQFGNYVVQKLLGQLKGEERERLVELIKPQLFALKKYNFGKQIAAIEKLIFTGPVTPASYAPLHASVNTTVSQGNSTAPTPSLTTQANSPQSCNTPPSTSASIVDGPTSGQPQKVESPVVRIETV